MISIGLTGWGDHSDLYPPKTSAGERLRIYARHFPVVEVDSSFYAILSPDIYQRWIDQTPEQFSFILKAYQGMTGHARGKVPFDRPADMFDAYLRSIDLMVASGKLGAVMFQFPPWFDVSADNVRKLKAVRKFMGELPLALEFRHQSWYAADMCERTIQFMREEGFIHIICDEPQVGQGSVPIILEPTSSELTMVRLHGRNAAGWQQGGAPNWQEVRNLYDYSKEELMEWKERLAVLQARGADKIYMIFNNDSGGHATRNGVSMMELLGQNPLALPPKQEELF